MKKIILVLTLLPILTACKKDPPIPFCEEFPDECVDIREVKDYFYFNIGSYWVYEEENSGMRDSVFVIETSSNNDTYKFSTKVMSSYHGYNYRFWADDASSDADNFIVRTSEQSTRVLRSKSKPGEFVAESTCFLFYPYEGSWTYNNGGTYIGYDNVITIGKQIPSMIINELEFINVVEVLEEHSAVEESQPTIHFYSRDIGLIRKELIDSSQVWNLIDYDIK